MKKRERRKRKSYIQDHRSRAKNVLNGEFESRFSEEKKKKTKKDDITDKVKKESKIVYQILQTPEFEKWIKKTDKRTLLRVEARLKLIVQQGVFGNFRNLKKKLYELKWKDVNTTRVYYTLKKSKGGVVTIVLLLCGGKKATQKRDIDKARKILELLEK